MPDTSHSNHPFTRRRFLQSTGAALLTAPLLGASTSTSKPAPLPGQRSARNVIFMVSDGMNLATLLIADYYAKAIQGRPGQWMELYRQGLVHRCLQETRSASSLVTDSAAASSAWGSGQRIPNRHLNVDANGRRLTPIGVLAKRAGHAVGLVTTTRITHATPAGFAAQAESRDDEFAIASQYLDHRLDVLLGGGSRQFDPRKRPDRVDLGKRFLDEGYGLLHSREEMGAATADHKPLLGLFYDDHLPYSIDRRQNADWNKRIPSLAEMFRLALDRLSRSGRGFLLQVEGGRVDHAAHANDLVALVHEQLDFDAAITLAVEFQHQHPETLLIITSDHGTGGLHLNGTGEEYNESETRLHRIGRLKRSMEAIGAGLAAARNQPDLWQRWEALTDGFPLRPNARHELAEWWDSLPEGSERGPAIAAIVNPRLNEELSVGWTTNNHTGEWVELAALGPGADRIPAMVENRQLFGVMYEALSLA